MIYIKDQQNIVVVTWVLDNITRIHDKTMLGLGGMIITQINLAKMPVKVGALAIKRTSH